MPIRKGFGQEGRQRQPQQGGGQQPDDPVSQAADQMAQFARDMGLPEGHVKQIKQDGPRAISEWTREVDQSGGVAKIMRMSQQFGNWLEQRIASGRQPEKQEMEQAILKLSQKFGVPEDVAKIVMEESLRRMKQAGGGQRQQGQSAQQGQQPNQQGGTNGNQGRV